MTPDIDSHATTLQWTAIMRALARVLGRSHGSPPAGNALQMVAASALLCGKPDSGARLAAALLETGAAINERRVAEPGDPLGLLAGALALRSGLTASAAVAGWAAARSHVVKAGLDGGGFSQACTILCTEMLDSSASVMRAHAEALARAPLWSLDAGSLASVALLARATADSVQARAIALQCADALRGRGFARGTHLLASACVLAGGRGRQPQLLERFYECARRLDGERAWPFYPPAIALLAVSPIDPELAVPQVASVLRSQAIPESWPIPQAARQACAAFVARQDLEPLPSTEEVAAFLAVLALAATAVDDDFR